MDYKKTLMEMIDNLIKGKLTVKEFDKMYYEFYIEQVPDDLFTNGEQEFFSSIQEKLDWVDSQVDSESRYYGWLNHENFVEWVKEQRLMYLGVRSKTY